MNLNGGYAMIKYNSTQEELAVAYKSKRPALFYDENQRSHWAVIEETATQSVDEETQEPITLYEYSYRLLDEESGGSGKEYLHIISISYPEIGGFCLNIKTNTNTPFTTETLISYLKELGHTNISKIMPCTPYSVGNDISNLKFVAIGVYCRDNIYLGIAQMRVSDGNLSISNGSTDKDYPNLTDTVTEV